MSHSICTLSRKTPRGGEYHDLGLFVYFGTGTQRQPDPNGVMLTTFFMPSLMVPAGLVSPSSQRLVAPAFGSGGGALMLEVLVLRMTGPLEPAPEGAAEAT